ncbi:MAG: VCBS repeat-containing protein [Nostoc sp. NMS1]|uniref:VCBS domain-containing protein n=1 Tax=Nostoc sp. NMS1 TaxID=2815388 RepID=UPI0025EC78B9|nr:VCBS domain-containing protein [Nostoc sp. NMS1]MBN3909063.1 VCBS repeat-containing protein [Nostoc sp. NMS1]
MATFNEQTGTANPFNGIDVGGYSTPTLADIDGDGDLDAIVGERDGTLFYYKNTGTATNPTYTQQTGTANPFNGIDVGYLSAPTFADIDGDGDLDAIVGERDGTLFYYKNTGTATNPTYTQQTGTANPFNGIDVGRFSSPTLADIDGDGDLDAIVGERDGTLFYYKNTGTATNPTYTQQTGTANPFNGIDVGYLSAPTFADIDGDGDLDAIVGAFDGTLLYYKNTGTATNPTYSQQTGTANPFNGIDVGIDSTPTFADIDGDGDLDAIVGEGDGTLRYFQNNTPPEPFAFVAATGTANPFNGIDVGSFSSPTLADIDGDGDLDAIVGAFDGTLLYYKNTGTATNPTYSQQTGTANPFNGIDVGYLSAPTFADIDGDGDLDAIVGEGDGKLLYYKNTGTATNPTYSQQTGTANPFNGIDVGYLSAPTFADIDGDGDLDAIVGAFDGTLLYYKNTGTATNPTYSQQTGTANPFNGIDVGNESSPTFADIDGDGDLDAIVGAQDGTLLYYKNTGTATNPTYSQQTGTANPFNGIDVGDYSAPTLADIDGDGDLDAIVGVNDGTLRYFYNTPNRPPVAVNDAVSTDENTVLNGNLLAANPTTPDSDPDGNPLTVTQVNGTATNVGSQINLGNGKLTVNADGTFSFNPNGGYETLTQAATATESFNYTISDGFGGTATATATITITGVNDTATITGTATGAVTEDASTPNLTATGALTVADVDTGENKFNTTVTGTGNLGSLTITNTGTWNYSVANSAVQSLGAGVTKNETFTVRSLDGTASQNIVVTITGVNDAATITGTATAAVTEDATTPNLTATGALTVADVDTGENKFNTTVTGTGNLGSLTITNTGTWNYSVANSAVQSLGAGVTKNETFTVQSVDGTASQNITVTINGVNDAPVAGTDSLTATQFIPTTIAVSTLLANDSDVDTGDVLKITGVSNAVSGAAVLFNNFTPNNAADDFIIFAPTNSGTGSFKYTVTDSKGGTTQGTVNLLIGSSQLGGNGKDTLQGNDGPDLLDGGNAKDSLYGGKGDDTLIGGNGDDLLVGGAGADLLVGGNDADTFRFALTDSLLSGFDRIADLQIGTDIIDGPNAVSAANLRKLGAVSALTQAGISAVLTNANFVTNGAATFSFGSRTFLALNDGTAGFQDTSDGVMEITGFSGSLTNLAIV